MDTNKLFVPLLAIVALLNLMLFGVGYNLSKQVEKMDTAISTGLHYVTLTPTETATPTATIKELKK